MDTTETARATSVHSAGEEGTLLIPLESRATRAGVLALTFVLAASLAVVILGPAIADTLVRRATTAADLERALAWDRRDATLHARLGWIYQDGGDYARARAHLEAALQLRPTDAYAWLYLASLADRQGDHARARHALETAVRLNPHDVTIRWEAGLMAFRWGDRERALEHFRYVLAVDPAQGDAAFQLAGMLLAPGAKPASLLPDDRDQLTNVLLAAIRSEDAALAEVAWTKRAAFAPPLPEDIARRCLDFLVAKGEGARARMVWRTLVPPVGQADGNALWNGGFEAERLLGWGLDWQVHRVWGVDVALDRFVAARGSRSLRLSFASFPSLDFGGVWQAVAVEPGREYHLRAFARAEDFTTRSGLKIQVVVPGTVEQWLAETATISGTTRDWVPLETKVQIPPGISLVTVRLRREPAREPEGNLGGKVWLDDVRLE